jgi:DNA-binding transcriptional MerR regulator
MKRSSADDESAALKIGAVARLTGISVHTLRKWEDRYGAVEPRRTEGGERVYTRTDLKRLAYIKRLANAGLSLREIAGQSLDELENAWEQASGMQMKNLGPASSEKVRVALLGQALPTLIQRQDATGTMLEVVASGDSQESLDAAIGEEAFDILIYECPSVTRGSPARVAELLRALSARCAIVVYGFGAQGHIASLRSTNVAVMRAPVDLDELEQIARGLLYGVASAVAERPDGPSFVAEAEVPAPKLSRQTIARIATTAPRIRCECPYHLADIVLGLRAFEEYSQDCENRNTEDAELHHFLWLSAARARAHFEDAIIRVAELEGISLEEDQ